MLPPFKYCGDLAPIIAEEGAQIVGQQVRG